MTIATGLGKFAAGASGLFVMGQIVLRRFALDCFLLNGPRRNRACIFDGRASDGRPEFDRLDVQRRDELTVEQWQDSLFRNLFLDRVVLARGKHLDVDVFKNFARSDADHAIGRFDEVVSFASGVLAAEVIGETERGVELLGFD